MDSRAATRVGLTIILGFVLFFFAWRFFAHLNLGAYPLYAAFQDTGGLQPQTQVRMSGVPIGEVEAVELDRNTLRPRVALSIRDAYKNRIPRDATISIASGLLISNPQIEITLPAGTTRANAGAFYQAGDTWDPAFVQQAPSAGLAQLAPEADQAVKQLTVTIKTLTPKLTATMDSLHGILKRTDTMMANFETASASARDLLTDPKIRRTMYGLLDDMQAVSHDARRTAADLTQQLRVVVKRNSGKVDELTNGAVDLLQKFADTIDAARGAVTKLTEQISDPRLQQSLLETLDLAKTTLARFNQIASDIHNLTGNPNVQNDIKSTVATMRETTQDAQQLVERLNSLVGATERSRHPRLGLGNPQYAISFLGLAQQPHFRSDIDVRIPIGTRNAADIGIFDFAERYKLNAQYETQIAGVGPFRYGIYASKLGVGLGWPSQSGSGYRVDLYDPNSPKLDARGLIRLNNDFSLWLGVDNIFQRPNPLIGLQLQR